MRRFLLAMVSFTLLGGSASAQDSGLADRLNRLERDMTFLQRQIYRGGPAGDPNAAPPVGGANDAQLMVQISQLQEEMRELRGALEHAQHANNALKQDMKLLQEDVDYRLQALEEAAKQSEEDAEEKQVPEENVDAEEDEEKPAKKAEEKTVKPSEKFEDSDAHYNRAFDLLNQKQYAKAAELFASFVRDFPKDPLVPNALYWQGESYYARGDYVRAAEGFRRGYQAAPEGQKAQDNLLKLGLSLANVKRKEEACVVLTQVITKFDKRSNAATRERAEQAKTRLKCS